MNSGEAQQTAHGTERTPTETHPAEGITAEGIPAEKNTRVILATVHSDAHMWNLVFLQMLLEEHGCTVHNLGQCTPVETVRDTALAERPELIVISSVNGHARIDALPLIECLRAEPALDDTRIIIGGKLGIQGKADSDRDQHLLEAGFDAVIESSENPSASQLLLELVSGQPRSRQLQGS